MKTIEEITKTVEEALEEVTLFDKMDPNPDIKQTLHQAPIGYNRATLSFLNYLRKESLITCDEMTSIGAEYEANPNTPIKLNMMAQRLYKLVHEIEDD